jgi:hypothetical protein
MGGDHELGISSIPVITHANIMKFITNNTPHCALRIDYRGKYIEETINTQVSWFTS